MQLMNVTGLSRDNVASHLQKHRLGLKRGRSRKRASGAAGKNKARRKTAFADEAAAAESGSRQAGGADCGAAGRTEALHEREGSNPHGNCGSEHGRGNDGSNGRAAGNEPLYGSDDGAGMGSDNRNSACVELATADVQNRQHAVPTMAALGQPAGPSSAAAALAAVLPLGQHCTPEGAAPRSGGGSNGEAGGSGWAPASGGGASRVGSSRATVGSGNGVNAIVDVGSRLGKDAHQAAMDAVAALR